MDNIGKTKQVTDMLDPARAVALHGGRCFAAVLALRLFLGGLAAIEFGARRAPEDWGFYP